MNILIVSYNAPWENGRLYNTFYSLSKNYNVNLICVSESIPDEYKNGNLIVSGNPRQAGFRNYSKSMVKLFKITNRFIKTSKVDLIYLCDYFIAPLHLVLFFKKHNIRAVYDAYELYLPLRKDRLRLKFFHFFERKAINQCDIIVSANIERALIMTGYYKLDIVPLVLNNVGFANSEIKPRQSLKLPLRIVYLGYISKERELIRFIEDLTFTSKKIDIRFTIFGHGPELDNIIEYIFSRELNNVKYGGPYLQDDLDSILSNQDIGYLNYLSNDFNEIYCEPLKLFDYASRGIPVISYRNVSLVGKLNSGGFGYSSDNILNSLIKIKDNYFEFSKNAIKYSHDHNWLFEEKKLTDAIEKLYEKN